MDHESRKQICQEIIQYILDSTQFTLRNIANLSKTPHKTIRSIYFENQKPHFATEINLIRLYLFLLEL